MTPKYKLFFSEEFKKSFGSFDDTQKKAIIRKLASLKNNPYRISSSLNYIFEGKRILDVTDDLRMIISVCEECKKKKKERMNGCIDCDNSSLNAVIIWSVFPH